MSDTIKITEAKVALRPHGITINRNSYGEYRVAFADSRNEASAYYTNDLWDAYSTGLAMSRARDDQRAEARAKARAEGIVERLMVAAGI